MVLQSTKVTYSNQLTIILFDRELLYANRYELELLDIQMLANHHWLTVYWRDECVQQLQDLELQGNWSINFCFVYSDIHIRCKLPHWCEVYWNFISIFSPYIYLCCICQRWVHFGKDLELLDSPGILPMRISDQTAAIKLAICDDIGERSYGVADIAAILVQMLARLPSVGMYHVSLERNKLLFSVSAFNL